MRHKSIGAMLALSAALTCNATGAAPSEPGPPAQEQEQHAMSVCPMMSAGEHAACAKMHEAKSAEERQQALQRHMKEMSEAHQRVMQAHMKERGMTSGPAHGTGRGPDAAEDGQGHADVDHASPQTEGATPHH